MSTILKALRRLEMEKSSVDGRPLQDEVAAATVIPSRRGFPVSLIAAAAAALGLGLGASLLWLWPREGAAPVVAAAPSAAPAAAMAPAAANVPSPDLVAPAPVPDSAAAVLDAHAPPAQAYASPVAVVERPPPPPVVEPAPAMAAEAVTSAPSASAAASAPKEAERAPMPGEKPPFFVPERAAKKAPPPAPVARPTQVARVEAPAVAPAQPVARKPAPPSPQKVVRANLPDVFVSSTIWHPQKDRRLAKVALAGGATREVHEGDAIGPLVVSRIEPSGVVFLHDGVELRQRVGAKN